jgi:hypothetical protein
LFQNTSQLKLDLLFLATGVWGLISNYKLINIGLFFLATGVWGLVSKHKSIDIGFMLSSNWGLGSCFEIQVNSNWIYVY